MVLREDFTFPKVQQKRHLNRLPGNPMSEYTSLLIHEQQLQRRTYVRKNTYGFFFYFQQVYRWRLFRMSNIIDRCTLREKNWEYAYCEVTCRKDKANTWPYSALWITARIKYSSLEINLQKDTDIEQYKECLCVRHVDFLLSFALSCHLNAHVISVHFY